MLGRVGGPGKIDKDMYELKISSSEEKKNTKD
jgi:hypothetical protein